MKKLCFEFLAVAVCGGVLALAANAISPRGLRISRNYFPVATNTNTTLLPSKLPERATNAPAATNQIAEKLKALGFGFMDSNAVAQAFNDPARMQNLLIFVDARDESHYQAGHVPGAFKLDYYRPENDLAVVLPAALSAEKIVVYCNGGSCEDSEFTAILLRDAGVPPGKLHIYGGGFSEWSTNNLPVELGQKDSQQFRQK